MDGCNLKIGIIGAGSVEWGPSVIVDLIREKGFQNCTLSLVDTDEKKLEVIRGVAEKIDQYFGRNISIQSSVDRREVLSDSDFVIITAEEDRIKTWKLDWEIPQEYGIKHTLGENRGPGGLSHTLRTVPLVLEMCKDIEELCPKSLVINLTNPEDRITYAARKYTNVNMVGYCDGLWDFKSHYLGNFLDIPGENIYIRGAGINHCVWMTRIINKETGENLYPKMVEKAKKEDWQPFSRHLYETYGLWPYENDEHVGEYFGHACEFCDCRGYDFKAHEEKQKRVEKKNFELIKGKYDVEKYLKEVDEWVNYAFGDFLLSGIIKGVYLGEERYLPNINLPNNGKVDGLPDDMIVEVPGVATPSGVQGEKFGGLPEPITIFCRREGYIQKLSAEAAAEGSRNKALKALILDDVVRSPKTAEELLDRFLEVHEKYFHTFFS